MSKADESESNNCDCDILQINDPFGSIGIQNFTKQNYTLWGSPYYFSTQLSMISSNNVYHTYSQYNVSLKTFEARKKYRKEDFHSFENKCINEAKKNFTTVRLLLVSAISRCLRDNNNCSGTRKLTWNVKGVNLKAKNPCQFPFIYKNVAFESCTKMDRDKFWCATTVNATNHQTSWGYCNDLCPQEDNISKSNQVAVKPSRFNIELVIGILVGILLMIACIIVGYRCTKKKKVITHKSGKYVLLDRKQCLL